MNRTKHFPQLLMAVVILKREDPGIKRQWDHGHDSWIYKNIRGGGVPFVLSIKIPCFCPTWDKKTNYKELFEDGNTYLVLVFVFVHAWILNWYTSYIRLPSIKYPQPETRRQITKSWLKIGTSVFARIIRTARWNWAAQIRIPTKSEAATNIGHMVPVSMFQQKYRVNVVSSCFVGTK